MIYFLLQNPSTSLTKPSLHPLKFKIELKLKLTNFIKMITIHNNIPLPRLAFETQTWNLMIFEFKISHGLSTLHTNMWIGLLWFQFSLGLGFPFFWGGQMLVSITPLLLMSFHKALSSLHVNTIIFFMLYFLEWFPLSSCSFLQSMANFSSQTSHHNIFVLLCCKGSSSFHFWKMSKVVFI